MEVKALPNIKSAKKRVKVIKTKTLRNQMIKSAVKTYIKKFEAAVAAGDKAVAEPAFNLAVKKIDQAVSKGIMKKNTASRRKSRLALMLNKVGA
ncbi:MAG: 30S ribosomal protein S20 [Ruminococcaceae bacterium]|nr:30S ribosomal protein S20 [Oscillospiraceae bacterium]